MEMSKEQEERLAIAAASGAERLKEWTQQLSKQEALIEQAKDWPHNRREAFGRVAK